MEKFLDVINRIEIVTSRVQENTTEARDVSGCRFSDVIEDETRFRTHGAVCCHSNFGRRTRSRNNKIISNKMKSELLLGLVDVHGDVVATVHLLLHVIIYFLEDLGFIPDDVLDALRFGDLSKFISTGGIGEPFSRDGEEQFILNVDADVAEGVGIDGLRPEDSGGVDGAIDHEVL